MSARLVLMRRKRKPIEFFWFISAQIIMLGDRAVERQKLVAERLASQMPTMAGMTAEERRRELRRTIANPGTYNLLDVTYNGDLKWTPAGDVIKGGTGCMPPPILLTFVDLFTLRRRSTK